MVIFLKDLCTFGCQKEGLSGNDRNDTGREKTSKTAGSQRRGKVKCIKGTGRRTVLEMRKKIPHLRLEKKTEGGIRQKTY